MKKILIIPISILLLTACAKVQAPNTQVEESVATQEVSKQQPETQSKLEKVRLEQSQCDNKDDRNCTIEIAKTMNNQQEKDEFLWWYVYTLKTPQKEDSAVCDEMTQGTKDNASCYWMLAMRLKDQSLCGKIKKYYTSEEEKMITNAENCKNGISYKNKDAEWMLKTGTPLYGDGYSYEGKATLKGWMEWDEYYNENNQQLFFHLSAEDQIKLPPMMQAYKREQFILVDKDRNQMPKEAEPKMKKYTKKNPLTIKVTKLYTKSEGATELTVEKFPQ